MKYILFSFAALICCVGMSATLVRFLTRNRTTSSIGKIALTVLVSALLITGAGAVYVGDYYHSVNVDEYLKTNNKVTVSQIENGYYFDGSSNEDAVIFYPGAKVEYTAYAPLMEILAEQGIDVFLLKMPLNMAFLGINRAADIIKNFPHDAWYVAGHSLGGVAAAKYAAEDEQINGVILLASYPTDKQSCRLLSIYGDHDGCLDLEKYEESRSNWPSMTVEKIISGGNHAQFGNYGFQKGDHEATITPQQQWQKTADIIHEWIKGGK